MSDYHLPMLQDIRNAANRLAGVAVKTPLIESIPLSEECQARVFIKPENLQRVGAFKFRGAYNRLCQLSDDEKMRGVVAFSSGNHAQGVAAAAKILAVRATIVMPSDAPVIKRDNTLGYGAEVVEYDRKTESREDIAQAIAARHGAVVVPAFEDFDVICGQGTTGLEIIEQGREMGVLFDQFYCPVGGGGLISGCATAIKSLSPDTEIHGVEPDGFDDVKRSLAAGKICANSHLTGTVCDALLTRSPGPMTFTIMQKYVSSILTVSDKQALQGVKYAWDRLKLVVEPGGAVALAALLGNKAEIRGKTICIILSGGNVDATTFTQALMGEK
ncbi:pyridoxal-phosphate dependent enzyme family protein [hydrothermal vent metagenome]|uniref:Pyridoxal-phosphate dependent enzyme family protein n=1 Tax=hydrothermal vent metagenome TaxID=652676 RepID=A0A3B0RYH2_9ZZZZ